MNNEPINGEFNKEISGNGNKKSKDNRSQNSDTNNVVALSPWDYIEIFDLMIIVQIKELAKYTPKSTVKTFLFGDKEFEKYEQKEFDKLYSQGSAEGEILIAQNLYMSSINGDRQSAVDLLTMKNKWNKDISESDDNEDRPGLLIKLTTKEL